MEFINQIVINIIVYLLITTVIVNLLGKSNYNKYVGIFLGMLLILIIITPILKVLKVSDKFDFFFRANEFTVESKGIRDKMEIMEEEQAVILANELNKTIKEQIKEFAAARNLNYVDGKIEFSEKSKDNKNMKILCINIIVSQKHKDEEISGDEEFVEKVNIGKIKIENKNKKIYKQIEEYQNNKEKAVDLAEFYIEPLKKDLSDFYHLSEDNINISIQE